MENDLSKRDPTSLILAAKNGDCDAFGALYTLYFTPVYRYVAVRVRTKEEAEDLVQTVFLKVYKSIGGFREQGKEPLAYFLTVARTTVIDYWRKKKDVLDDEEETIFSRVVAETPNIGERIDRDDRLARVRKLLETLTPEQREVLTLKYLSDLSTREIAQLLNKKEAAVRQLQCRALRVLRDTLHHEP